MREMVGGCCVCSDDRGWSENPLVYCDGQSCTVAVHQACYGIVSVPTGPWYCRKCESQERAAKVKCELCPSRYGALKRTDNAGWAHVVCALYIPEVRFGNVTTMEPIQLQLIPPERFNKVCYICEEKGKPANASVGACMQCNRAGCKQQFHVTCAQSLGLLCEEAGNYLDNVKYCGYCQYHYSKLKKGGNVKTIPPYKPVSTENHLSDSNSEKDAEGGGLKSSLPSMSTPATSTTSTISNTSSSSKRKSSSSSKSGSSTSSTSKSSSSTSGKSSSPNQNTKTTSSSSSHHKSSDKSKVSSSGSSTSGGNSSRNNAKSASTSDEHETKNEHHVEPETITTSSSSSLKESKGSKKRKVHSRTPTPVSVDASVSVVVSSNVNNESGSTDKSETNPAENVDKSKKVKVETTQSIISNQPIVALTSISTIKPTPPRLTTPPEPPPPPVVTEVSQTIIQTTTSTQPPPQPAPVTSLVVSVPLSSTSLSPHPYLVSGNNQGATSVVVPNVPSPLHEKIGNVTTTTLAGEDLSNNLDSLNLEENSRQNTDSSCGGLKITYEKQETMNITEEDMELEEIPAEIAPVKRTRATIGRGKKRGNAINGIQLNSTNSAPANNFANRAGRGASRTQNVSASQHEEFIAAPIAPLAPPGAFAGIGQNQMKQSPPSSPSPEAQQPLSNKMKPKGRKSAPASITPSSSRDSKDIKFFQNGVVAPHMLGNQLNPTSNMAQKMSDHLNSELEAHSIFNPNENANMMGPQLHHKVIATARSNSTGSTASANSGLSGILGGSSGNIPQTLDQLLERQWEQGSQFLMEQAQHFDIASLLSCLHQLRAENLRLEEHVSSLLQRRDHLLAVNARLAIPLTGQPATPQSSHPHAINNIHPAVGGGHGDIPRSRHSTGSSGYPAHLQGSTADVPIENGLPPDSNQLYPSHHRSPAPGQPQRSPTMRLSPAASSYTNSTLVRQSSEASGRSAPRPQPYSHYQGPGTSAQQMVIRRENEVYAQSSKPPS